MSRKILLTIILVIAILFICTTIGTWRGMIWGENSSPRIEYNGAVGYEAGGQIGMIIGLIVGLFIDVVIVATIIIRSFVRKSEKQNSNSK